MAETVSWWATYRDKWGLKPKQPKRCACGVEIGTNAPECRGCRQVRLNRLRNVAEVYRILAKVYRNDFRKRIERLDR